jgi:amino acid transporter
MPTLVDLLFLFIGSVIGSGIFLSPGQILKLVNGSVGLSMLVWVAGGVMSLLGALTYAELALANPEAGGLYCYIRDGFGRLPAFLYGWCLFLVISAATIAALARAFARYLTEIIPLTPMESNAAAVLMITVVTVVNVRGTRQSSDLQNWTTLVKGGLVVVLNVVLLALGKHGGEIIPAAGTQMHGLSLFSSFSLAIIAVLWAYEGWQFGTYSAGEVIEPQKVFPRAFLLGSLILIGLYVVAVMAYLVALGPEVASNSDTIAAAAGTAVLGPWAGKLLAPDNSRFRF